MQHTKSIVITLTKEYKINLPVCLFHNNMLVFLYRKLLTSDAVAINRAKHINHAVGILTVNLKIQFLIPPRRLQEGLR